MDCATIQELINSSKSPFVSCHSAGDLLALTTPFMYPDGDYVEFFVEVKHDHSIVITDCGETYRYLLDHDFDLFANKIRRDQVLKVASDYEVKIDSCELIKTVEPPEQFFDAAIDFGQCIVRISDFILMKRTRTENSFQSIVREYFEETNISFEEKYVVCTDSGSEYKIDFLIRPKMKKPALLEVISTQSQNNLIQAVDKKVRLWTDISFTPSLDYARISLIDDTLVSWRSSDIKTLNYLSEIYMWSRKDLLRERLA